MTTTEVEEIIKSALGLKDTDTLKVVDVKFNRPKAELLAMEEAGGMDFIAIAGQASMGVMAVCALLVLKMFSGSGKKKKRTSKAGKGESPAASSRGDNSDEDEYGVDPQLLLRQQITMSLQENPEQAKQLLTSWLDDGS